MSGFTVKLSLAGIYRSKTEKLNISVAIIYITLPVNNYNYVDICHDSH